MKKKLVFTLVFAALLLGGQSVSAQDEPRNVVYPSYTKIDTFAFSPSLEVGFRCLWLRYYSSRGLDPDTTKNEGPQYGFRIVITHSNDADANRRTYLQVIGADNSGRVQVLVDHRMNHIYGENEAGEFVFGYCPSGAPCFSFSAKNQKKFKQELKELYNAISEMEMDVEF